MNLSLEHKTALVCGGSDGIGWAAAQELALLGANVCLFARNEEKLKTRIAQLDQSKKQKHRYLVANFSNLGSIQAALKADSGEFHVLVNNTGGPAGGTLIAETPEKFKDTFEQHLMANQLLAQHAVPFMKAEKFGRIINVISISVNQPIIGLGVSNTVRWAVAAWAKTLSKELAHTGITVNNVLPGYTQTSRLAEVNRLNAEKTKKNLQEYEQQLIEAIPSGRFAEAYEVGAAVAFLASPVAASINGSNLTVDGGLSASL